jgi:uncharacterized protein (TIGR00725 family)
VNPYVAVCGAGDATEQDIDRAERVGRLLAEGGAIVLCGGLAGVMDAAARGATEAGGLSVGLLPKEERAGASRHLSVSLPLGMGEARNALLVRAADAVIAIGGGWGTLSEVALAMKMGKRVIGLDTWELSRDGLSVDGIRRAGSPEEAVRLALEPA